MLRFALLLLALVGWASGDLTGRLVEDSDNMANIVGAKETLSLVDYKLHKEQGKRESLASVAKDAKEVAGKRYREMQEAEAADARVTNELRHLKSRLAIDKDSSTAKQAVAAKAEAVAKRMELLAEQTARDAAAALKQQQHDQQQLAATKRLAEQTAQERARAEKERREAEGRARDSAAALAAADTGVQSLLRRHSKLEKMQLEEETRQTTRLADAFKEDARRQEEFKQSLAAAKARERAQRRAAQGRDMEAERRAKEAEAAGREAGREERERGEVKVASLAHALLRANPELEDLIPHGGEGREEGEGGEGRGQQLSSGGGQWRGGGDSGDGEGGFAEGRRAWSEFKHGRRPREGGRGEERRRPRERGGWREGGEEAREKREGEEEDADFEVPAGYSPRV